MIDFTAKKDDSHTKLSSSDNEFDFSLKKIAEMRIDRNSRLSALAE